MAIPTTTAALDKEAIRRAEQQIAQAQTHSKPAIVTEFETMAANSDSTPKQFDPAKILVTEFANRDPNEFLTDEFKIFKASIEMTAGNEVPGTVYALENPTAEGHTHALIFGHRRLTACLETNRPFKAIVQPKPEPRLQIAKMTRENDDRSGTAVWKRAHWVVENLKHFDSPRQYHYHTGTPESLISKYQMLVTLPQDVIDLCVSTLDVKLEAGYALAVFRNENPTRFEENLAEVKGKHPKGSLPFNTLAKLLSAKKEKSVKPTDSDIVIKDSAGNDFATVKINRAKELRIVVKDGTPADLKRFTDLLQRMR